MPDFVGKQARISSKPNLEARAIADRKRLKEEVATDEGLYVR